MKIQGAAAGIITALFLFSLSCAGQETEEVKPNRVYFGGDFSLMFGTVTFIEVSPIAGYRFTPRFSSGGGIIYLYYRERTYNDYIFKSNIYGGRIFSKYTLLTDMNEYIPLGLHAGLLGYCEYEALNMDSFLSPYHDTGRFWLNSFYVGGGLELPAGRRTKMNFLVLYNVNDTGESPYSNPVVRISVVF